MSCDYCVAEMPSPEELLQKQVGSEAKSAWSLQVDVFHESDLLFSSCIQSWLIEIKLLRT